MSAEGWVLIIGAIALLIERSVAVFTKYSSGVPFTISISRLSSAPVTLPPEVLRL